MTIPNLAIFSYWVVVWIKSSMKYRDIASLLILVFIVQGLLSELWFGIAGFHAVFGESMASVMFYGSITDRILTFTLLCYAYYLIVKMRREQVSG